MSTTSSKLLARQINLDRKRAELQAIHTRDPAMAKAAAEGDAEARIRNGEAKLKVEEKCIAISKSD